MFHPEYDLEGALVAKGIFSVPPPVPELAGGVDGGEGGEAHLPAPVRPTLRMLRCTAHADAECQISPYAMVKVKQWQYPFCSEFTDYEYLLAVLNACFQIKT